jgi:hypothetical protein
VSDLPPTSPEPVGLERLRRSRTLRRIGLAVLTVIVVAGAVGVFGIRTRTVTARSGGYTMSLQYPATDRADQPVHWVLTLVHPGGFTGPVDVAVTQSYLDLLDVNAIQPEPTGSRTDGGFVVWTFAPPAGATLRVLLDANIQLNAHLGAAAVVSLLDDQGNSVVSVRYRTWVAP